MKDLSKSGIDPTQGAIGDENPFSSQVPKSRNKPMPPDRPVIVDSNVISVKIIGEPDHKLVREFNNQMDKVKSITDSQIKTLALDIATSTGWCTRTASGTWDFKLKKDESKGMRLIRFRAKLRETCELEQIKLIVFEQLATYGKFPNFVAAEMQGVLKLFCEENKIEYRSYAPKAIKLWGTGSGGAKKLKMIDAAKKYKPDVESDDEADAIILYHFAIDDLKLNP